MTCHHGTGHNKRLLGASETVSLFLKTHGSKGPFSALERGCVGTGRAGAAAAILVRRGKPRGKAKLANGRQAEPEPQGPRQRPGLDMLHVLQDVTLPCL